MKGRYRIVPLLVLLTGLFACKAEGESEGQLSEAPVDPASGADTTPPTVALSNPGEGDVIEGPIVVSATASDDSGIMSVAFYIGDDLLREDSSSPFNANWNPAAGSYTVRAVATDDSAEQNQASVSVSVTVVQPSGEEPPDDTPPEDPPGEDPPVEDPPVDDPPGEDPPPEDPPDEDPPSGDAPVIAPMGLHEVSHGDVFVYEPEISGDVVLCRKDLGHDDVEVDSESGRIEWDTSALRFGRGFHIRIKCSNYAGSAYASMVVHVDKTGSSRLRVAGEGGVSPYVGVAGRSMTSGDTIVFPDGLYPVSVSGDESYENAFKTNAPRSGTADQFSTLIAETPGGVVISGAPRNGMPKQKNAFQLTAVSYVAIVGMVVKDIKREAFTAEAGANHLLLDFLGTAGAGTNGEPCSNFSQAADGWCSKAGMRVNGGTPLIQHSYDWGQNRYGIMTRSTSGSVTRRSFVRLDEHRGDQPYGGFSDYCDTAHLSQDNTVFDSLAIAAPFYKNYAGLSAFPATGCESVSANLKTAGLLAVNNDLSLSLMDQKAGPAHVWEYIVSYDSEGTCTPQTNQCGNWLLQADKSTIVRNSFFGRARGFGGSTAGSAFNGAINMEGTVAIDDVPGQADRGTVPQYLPASLLYYRGRSDSFYGDPGYDEATNVRRWPIGGEDIIAENMRSYDNPSAFAVGGGTVHIEGNRGGAAADETLSEYFWGYIDDYIPPLAVRVKDKGSYHRVAWEHHSSWRRDIVEGWKVLCVASGEAELAALPEDQLQYNDNSGCEQYAVKAVYEGGDESGIAYVESPE